MNPRTFRSQSFVSSSFMIARKWTMVFVFISSSFLLLESFIVSSNPISPSSSGHSRPTSSSHFGSRSSCSCGQSPVTYRHQSTTHEYVVGGHESSPNSFPWMVALLDNYGFNFCGASLIRPNLAITAAHCVHNKKPESIQAIIGYNDLDLALLFNRVTKVTAIKIHPLFIHAEWAHDIALLKLSPSPRNIGIEPICLPSRSERNFQNLLVAGWGRTSTSPLALKPHKLRQVTLPQVDQAICEHSWSENRVGSSQLCAGSAGKDTCTYDSGSPLMSADPRTGTTVLAGITSFGSKRCGDPEKPGVYTRTASYLDWIETYASDFPCY